MWDALASAASRIESERHDTTSWLANARSFVSCSVQEFEFDSRSHNPF